MIPPRNFKSRHIIRHGIYVRLREAMSDMQPGDSSDWPIACEAGVRVIASRLGIKAVSRRLGREDQITVYRVR